MTQTVLAECHDCDDRHPVGEREMGWTTTMCPICGSTSYGTVVDGDRKPPDLTSCEARRYG